MQHESTQQYGGPFISELVCFWTYYVTGSAHTGPGDAVAVGSVGAGTQLPAALAIITSRTGLVAVEPRPSGCTGALT